MAKLKCVKVFDRDKGKHRGVQKRGKTTIQLLRKIGFHVDEGKESVNICARCRIKAQETEIDSTNENVLEEQIDIDESVSNVQVDISFRDESILINSNSSGFPNDDFMTDDELNDLPYQASSVDTELLLEKLNPVLFHFGLDTLTKDDMRNKKKSKNAFQCLVQALKSAFKISEPEETDSKIVQTLVPVFQDVDRKEKIRILTILPLEWSSNKVCKIFECGRTIVETARNILQSRGPYQSSTVKSSPKKISNEVVDTVKAFYRADNISRVMPGSSRSNFVSVKINGIREKFNKRLLLFNVEEVHGMFKAEHPLIKV